MSAYLIARLDVHDLDEFMKYASQTVELASKYGGRYLAKGGAHEYLEGDGPSRIVIVEFPDMDAARAWQASDEYRAIVPIRQASSTGDIVVVDGFTS